MRCAVLLCISLVFLLGACHPAAAPVAVSNRATTKKNDPPAERPLKEMKWVGSDGKPTGLSNLAGKVVILDFWATYCPPCREEIPHLNDLHSKFADGGLVVIGLNSGGEEDRPKIAAFLKETPIKYEIAYPDDELSNFIFANDDRIPQTLVIDRSGRLVRKMIGLDEFDTYMDDTVRAAMSGQ